MLATLACTTPETAGSSAADDPVECSDCGAGQACIGHLGGFDTGEEDRYACIDLPTECATPACDDNVCWNALYDHCDEGWIGVGCSDPVSDFPMIYSCNPDN